MTKTLKLSGNMVTIPMPPNHDDVVTGGPDWEEMYVATAAREEKLRVFVADMAAFIRYYMAAGRSNDTILNTLIHDIMGAHREGLDGLFLPRVSGYASPLEPETTRESETL